MGRNGLDGATPRLTYRRTLLLIIIGVWLNSRADSNLNEYEIHNLRFISNLI
jgi:hypothetical protein